MVDVSCGGTFMLKSEDDAWSIFETLAENSLHHASSSRTERSNSTILKKADVFEVSHDHELRSQVNSMAQKLDQLLSVNKHSTPQPSQIDQVCALCSHPSHLASDCPTTAQFPEYIQEQVQAAQTFNSN